MEESEASSTSSDEEVLEILRVVPRVRIIRDRGNPFHFYDEAEFCERFRLNKRLVMDILQKVGNNLEPLTNRSKPITPLNQLLITLRFFATGTFQIVVGDTFRVHKSTVCRIIKKVTHQLALLRPQYICFPKNEHLVNMKTKFFNVAGFPSVIGCIDGTHIPIQSPGGDNAELFRNRKGYFSINVQVVCDADLKIIDIVSRWPGSTHDSTIFNASYIRAQLEAKELGSGYLLGDSAYPCRPYLMTPIANPATAAEHRYNASQIKTRNIVERSFGVWKRRFPCLALGLRTTVNTTLSVIVATAILNNLAIIPDANIDDVNDFGEAEEHVIEENPNALGNALRNTIIDTYFN